MTSNFPLHFGGVFRLPFIFGSWFPHLLGLSTDNLPMRPGVGPPAPVLAKPRSEFELDITTTLPHSQNHTPRDPKWARFKRAKHGSSLSRTGRARATKSANRWTALPWLPQHIDLSSVAFRFALGLRQPDYSISRAFCTLACMLLLIHSRIQFYGNLHRLTHTHTHTHILFATLLG